MPMALIDWTADSGLHGAFDAALGVWGLSLGMSSKQLLWVGNKE